MLNAQLCNAFNSQGMPLPGKMVETLEMQRALLGTTISGAAQISMAVEVR